MLKLSPQKIEGVSFSPSFFILPSPPDPIKSGFYSVSSNWKKCFESPHSLKWDHQDLLIKPHLYTVVLLSIKARVESVNRFREMFTAGDE